MPDPWQNCGTDPWNREIDRMMLIRLCALFSLLLLPTACEGGGLLADKPPTTVLEPVPASTSASMNSNTKPDVTLRNTYWKLTELNGGPVKPGEGRELHMILKATDQVSGYSGCNQFTGSVTATDTTIALGPLAATRRMCESVMDQEMEFLQALENAARYVISGEDMSINDAHGAIIMRFVAVYME